MSLSLFIDAMDRSNWSQLYNAGYAGLSAVLALMRGYGCEREELADVSKPPCFIHCVSVHT